MRIPSELHGETLYGRKSAKPTTAYGQSWRRVIRLVILMTLIIVVMRQAAHSGVYAIFFPATEHKKLAPQRTPTIVTKKITPERTSKMMQLARSEFDDWVKDRPAGETSTLLGNFLSGDPLLWQEDDEAIKGESESQQLTALAIQQNLIAAMKDGTVWRAADGPGLMATLAMHEVAGKRFSDLNNAREAAVTAGVLPLLQQPGVYLGQTVVASGEVVQIEQVRASENPFAIASYWNLWLLPRDASNRPWLVIVPDLPPELMSLIDNQTPEQDSTAAASDADSIKQSWYVKSPRPQVDVDGEFLKRLSYRSTAGAELTPVVAGHVAAIHANGNSAVAAAIGQSEPHVVESKEPAEVVPLLWIVLGSVGIGLLIAIAVMWRTATLNREMRARRNRHPVKLGVTWMLVSATAATFATTFTMTPVAAQSMLDLLPGYDVQRMHDLTRQAQPTLGSPQIDIDELAKIVFRVNRLSPTALQSRLAQSASPPNVADAVAVDSEIVAAQPLTVSTELQEYLEIQQIEMIRLADEAGVPRVLFSIRLPGQAVAGDRVSAVAVRIRTADSTSPSTTNQDAAEAASANIIVDVAGRLNWAPIHPQSPAEAVLAQSGVDLSRLNDIFRLDRQPLSDADSPLFYPMIGAAAVNRNQAELDPQLRDAVRAMRESTVAVSPVDLLQNPNQFTGDWIGLDVETVRITRIAVESSQRRREIGGDFYYEIDAIGDLGNVSLKIEVPGGEPIMMEHRYPVTIVAAELPTFLLPGVGDEEQLVVTRSVPIRVNGFFYRLWSYESDLMKSHGGKQFAPLIIAGVIEDRRSASSDPIGVQIIGNVAAVGVIAAIIGVIVFGIITRRGDRRARQRKKNE